MDTRKRILIYVRGRKYEVKGEKVSYDEIVSLAYPDGKRGPDYEYDVTWKDGPGDRSEGILKEGETIQVIEDMRFDVKFTDKS